LAFHTPDPFGPGHSQLAHKALYGLIGIGETVFLHQILVNALGAEPDLDLGYNHLSQRFAWFFRPTPSPAVEMAGFTSLDSSEPVVEMAGFANSKYRPTVSRSIPSSGDTSPGPAAAV
jgi:hypothetical protein